MAETPEHVEKHPSGITTCRHCCGEVGEDGYSAGGMVESEGDAMLEGETDEMPQQGVSTERMRDAAFAQALSQGGVAGYAEGGEVEDEWVDMGTHQIHRDSMAPDDWAAAQANAKMKQKLDAPMTAGALPNDIQHRSTKRFARMHRPGSKR